MKILIANSDALKKFVEAVRGEFLSTPIVVKDDDSWVPNSYPTTTSTDFVPRDGESYVVVRNGLSDHQITNLIEKLEEKGVRYEIYRYSRRKGFIRN